MVNMKIFENKSYFYTNKKTKEKKGPGESLKTNLIFCTQWCISLVAIIKFRLSTKIIIVRLFWITVLGEDIFHDV